VSVTDPANRGDPGWAVLCSPSEGDAEVRSGLGLGAMPRMGAAPRDRKRVLGGLTSLIRDAQQADLGANKSGRWITAPEYMIMSFIEHWGRA
jgi:hypothetical protein